MLRGVGNGLLIIAIIVIISEPAEEGLDEFLGVTLSQIGVFLIISALATVIGAVDLWIKKRKPYDRLSETRKAYLR